MTNPFRFAVYSGCEKFDYGDKHISVLCRSEEQAKHMAKFWEGSGYYEKLPEPLGPHPGTVAAERERCANIAEAHDGGQLGNQAGEIAVAIRSGRGPGPIIDYVSTPPELCGHESFCRQVSERRRGWHHCNEACPQLHIGEDARGGHV